MRTTIALCIALLNFASAYGQDSAALDQVVRKRDALLTEILAVVQSRKKDGTGTEEEVRAAEINLYALRRDCAKTLAERVQWQQRILALEKEARAQIEKKMEVGVMTAFDKLLAEERVTAAEQKLLELNLAKQL